jgi:biotin carboxylase
MTQPIVIVNPTSSGSELAPAFAKQNIPAIAVRLAGSGRQGNGGFANQIQTENFIDVLQEGEGLIDTLAKFNPRAIIAGTEAGVPLADELAAALTPTFANVPKFAKARYHKALMQEALENAGLPVIRTLNTADPNEVEAWLAKHDLVDAPLVVKPPASAGSDKVHHIPSAGDWRTPFEHILATPAALLSRRNESVIVQEEVSGTEYAVDTVSAAGKHELAHLIRYHKTALGDGAKIFDYTEFVAFDEDKHGELVRYAENALDALGIRWGAAHCEIMLTPNGPRLIEIGSRMCGGPVLGFARAATGSSQVERVVESYLHGVISTRPYKLNQTVVPVFLAAPVAGVLRNVEVLEQLKTLPTHLVTHMWNKNGSRVQRTVDFGTTIGIVALAGQRDAIFNDYKRVRDVEAQMIIDQSAK